MISLKPNDNELGLKGKGVEPARIPSLDNLVAQYDKDRERAEEAANKEEEAANSLIDAMHKHAEQLRQPDGTLIYKTGDMTVSLVTDTSEKLKVKKTGAK